MRERLVSYGMDQSQNVMELTNIQERERESIIVHGVLCVCGCLYNSEWPMIMAQAAGPIVYRNIEHSIVCI